MADRIPIALLSKRRSPDEATAPPSIIEIADPTFRPEVVETRRDAFASNRVDHALAGLCNLDCGIEAERAGYRGLMLNTFGDYGVDLLRAALSIPVVGAGEASMAVARTLGQRFAIVTIWPRSMAFLYAERLKACNAQDACVGVIHVGHEAELLSVQAGADETVVTRMRDGDAAILDRIVEAGERAVRELGAEVIVLGCTCMASIGPKVAARMDVPVVEPMRAGYKYLEMLVRLRLSQSKVAYAAPPPSRLNAVAPAVLGLPLLGADDENCEVCLIAGEA